MDDIKMICCTILCNNGSSALVPLVQRIHDAGGTTFLHLDSKSTPVIRQLARVLVAKLPSCALLPSTNASWGGYSLVSAALSGFRIGCNGSEWLLLLSDTHLPIRPIADLIRFLSTVDADAVLQYRGADMNPSILHSGGRFCFTYLEEPGLGIMRTVSRPPRHKEMLLGSQWVALRSSSFMALKDRIETEEPWYRESFVPDETFFPNVILNSGKDIRVLNQSLTFQRWENNGPAALGSLDLPHGPYQFFARKYIELPSDMRLSDEERFVLNRVAEEALDQTKQKTIGVQPETGDGRAAEIISFIHDYLSTRLYPEAVVYLELRDNAHEIQVRLKGCPDVFLLIREAANKTSICVASYTYEIPMEDTHPLICPKELRTPLIRYKSLITERPMYSVSHPSLGRLGFLEAVGSRPRELNSLAGWLDILVSLLEGSASTRAGA